MNHLFISYKLALLAKNKGFNEKCLGYFNHKQNFYFMDIGISNSDAKQALPDGTVAAPLYQQIIDWFREKHDIHISAIFDTLFFRKDGGRYRPYINQVFYRKSKNIIINGKPFNNNEVYNTPIEAYNKAIKEAFKLIN